MIVGPYRRRPSPWRARLATLAMLLAFWLAAGWIGYQFIIRF